MFSFFLPVAGGRNTELSTAGGEGTGDDKILPSKTKPSGLVRCKDLGICINTHTHTLTVLVLYSRTFFLVSLDPHWKVT